MAFLASAALNYLHGTVVLVEGVIVPFTQEKILTRQVIDRFYNGQRPESALTIERIQVMSEF